LLKPSDPQQSLCFRDRFFFFRVFYICPPPSPLFCFLLPFALFVSCFCLDRPSVPKAVSSRSRQSCFSLIPFCYVFSFPHTPGTVPSGNRSFLPRRGHFWSELFFFSPTPLPLQAVTRRFPSTPLQGALMSPFLCRSFGELFVGG